jgi:hypothetical protein
MDTDKMDLNIRARVPRSLVERIERIYARHGVPEAVLVRDAVTALCAYIEAEDCYRRPIEVVPARDLVRRQGELDALLVAEPPGHYGTGEPVDADHARKARRAEKNPRVDKPGAGRRSGQA